MSSQYEKTNLGKELLSSSSPFDSSYEEMSKAVSPYIENELSRFDPAWVMPVFKKNLSTYRQYLRWKLQNTRQSEFIRSVDVVEKYYTRWSKFDLSQFDPSKKLGAVPCVWKDKRILVDIPGLRRGYLLRVMKVIDEVKPKSICEIGYGNGINLLVLSACYPDIDFYGIELTPEGVRSAQNVQQLDELPPGLVRISPREVQDMSAHKRISFQQGNAADIAFEDNKFDLVCTFASVEQMETIRHQALSEISRISNGHVSLIEPFRDVNATGVKRAYIQGMNYFQGWIGELSEYGLEPLSASIDMPMQINLSLAHVVAKV